MATRVNVFDFDRTIYKGDSSFGFIAYCMLRNPRLWRYLPRQLHALARYVLGNWSRTQVKEVLFVFLQDLPDIDDRVEAFWSSHEHHIAQWYQQKHQQTDIIISASPEFLLRPIATKLGVKTLIATQMNPKNGAITGKNCQGKEKVRRLTAYNPTIVIDEFYSDSLSDLPLFEQAQQPFVVKGECITPFADYTPSKLTALSDPAFIRFLMVGGINASLGILFSFLFSLLLASALLAFVIGFSLSLVISYFLNGAITFKEIHFSVRQFIRFCASYMPNFAILFCVVFVLVDVLHLYPLIAYISAAVIAAPITFLLLSTFTFTGRNT